MATKALPDRTISDSEGLKRAYEQRHAHARGNALCIAGSHAARDWHDDVTTIPAWGDLKNSERYQQADKALRANPNITRVVGHSLGGSVALELEKNSKNRITDSRTHGAPAFDPLGSDKRTR